MMTPLQGDAFNVYVALGNDRTIEATYAKLQEDPKFASVKLRTLARWGTQYSWRTTAAQVGEQVIAKAAQQISDKLAPVIESMMEEQIEALHTIQRRFAERLKLDPADPTLTDEERS